MRFGEALANAQGTRIIGWLVGQTDMLAFDWCVADDEENE